MGGGRGVMWLVDEVNLVWVGTLREHCTMRIRVRLEAAVPPLPENDWWVVADHGVTSGSNFDARRDLYTL